VAARHTGIERQAVGALGIVLHTLDHLKEVLDNIVIKCNLPITLGRTLRRAASCENLIRLGTLAM
jgi:hypothetical protein